MSKPSTRDGRKSRSPLLISRALIEKENRQRALRSLRTRHENARKAQLLSSLSNLIPKKIPAAVIKEFKAAAKLASKAGPRRTIRVKG
jgi:hypothetical protein